MKLTAIFKQKLNESDWEKEHERLHIQEMKDWIQKMRIQNTRVVKEGNEWVIHGDSNVKIRADDLPLDDDNKCYLPFKFGEVNGDFAIIGNGREKMKSLENGPLSVYGNYKAANLWLDNLKGMAGVVHNECDLSHNVLTDWSGIPSQCGKLIIHHNKIKSFTGISKEWVMGSSLVCDVIQSNLYELIEVEGLDEIDFEHDYAGTSFGPEVNKAERILNTCLQGSREAIDLQSDLFDEGLEDWTKK